MLWSAAENSVTSPTPTIASATPNRKLSMRRVSASQSAAEKLDRVRQSLSSSPSGDPAPRAPAPAFVSPAR